MSDQLTGVADAMDVQMDTSEADVRGGLFMQKAGVTQEQLSEAKTQKELKALGKTTMTMKAAHVQRLARDHFLLDGVSFTPCDCDPLEPSWHIQSTHADIRPGERALLSWPIVFVYKVPVFALPWMYLPLSNRQTGLLVPKPYLSGVSGFGLDLPVFVTLGESADMTFTPGYFLGQEKPENLSGTPGVKGPRLLTEFRYTPGEQHRGTGTIGLLYDLNPRRNPRTGADEGGGDIRGLRWQASWAHFSDWDNGFGARLNYVGAQDAFLPRSDLTTDVLATNQEYMRSTAVGFWRGEDVFVSLDASLLQDFGTATVPGGWGFRAFSEEAPRTLQRLPALTLAIPDRRVAGPLFFSFRAEATRLAPLSGGAGDICGPLLRSVEECILPREQRAAYEHPGRLRLDLFPRLSTAARAGDALRVSAYAAARMDGWLSEVSQARSYRAYPLLGATVDTVISGDWGASGLRHLMTPSVETRYVPGVVGGLVETPYGGEGVATPFDAIDSAIPRDRFLQSVAQLSNRLLKRSSGSVAERVRLDLGMTFDWLRPDHRVATAFARSGLGWGPLSVNARGSYDLSARALEGVLTDVALRLLGGFVSAAYEIRATTGYERSRRTLDGLVGEAATAGRTFQQQLSFSFGYTWRSGLGLRYGALMTRPAPDPTTGKYPWLLQQHSLGASWSPSCDCWTLDAGVFTPGLFDRPSVGVNLTIKNFGSFGVNR